MVCNSPVSPSARVFHAPLLSRLCKSWLMCCPSTCVWSSCLLIIMSVCLHCRVTTLLSRTMMSPGCILLNSSCLVSQESTCFISIESVLPRSFYIVTLKIMDPHQHRALTTSIEGNCNRICWDQLSPFFHHIEMNMADGAAPFGPGLKVCQVYRIPNHLSSHASWYPYCYC